MMCLIQVKNKCVGEKQLNIFKIFVSLKRMQRTHVKKTGAVITQGFVWKFLCAIYKFSFIHQGDPDFSQGTMKYYKKRRYIYKKSPFFIYFKLPPGLKLYRGLPFDGARLSLWRVGEVATVKHVPLLCVHSTCATLTPTVGREQLEAWRNKSKCCLSKGGLFFFLSFFE